MREENVWRVRACGRQADLIVIIMNLRGQIKLSQIFDHNFDRNTDRLYQPLRLAVQTLPSAPTTSNDIQSPRSSLRLAEMQCSRINISKAEQDQIV